MKTVIGVLLAFSIGALCRVFDVPLPSPTRLIGAVLVLSITLGYIAADRLLPSRTESPPAAVAE